MLVPFADGINRCLTGGMPTHEVTNQVPPLVDFNAAAHPALLAGLRREGAAWAEPELTALGRLAGSAQAQQSQGITLQQAKTMALKQNSQLLIQREKIVENQEKVREAKSKRYPLVVASGNYAYNGVSNNLTLPKGSFGNYPALNASVPDRDITLLKSQHNLYSFGGLAAQPIIEQGKINAGIKIAGTDLDIAHTRVRLSEQQVDQAVEKLYYGTLIARKKEESIKTDIELIKVKLHDVEGQLLAGRTDSSIKTGLEADLADREEKFLEAANQREDDEGDLSVIMGLSYTSTFILSDETDSLPMIQPIEFYLQSERTNNLDIQLAGHGCVLRARRRRARFRGGDYSRASAIRQRGNPLDPSRGAAPSLRLEE